MPAPSGKFQFVRPLAVVLILAAALKIFVLDAVVVSGGSMEPALRPGDHLLIDKTGYALTDTRVPSRGEIVAFRFPDHAALPGTGTDRDEEAIMLKRCVAIPGDSLHPGKDSLRVNGVTIAVGPGDPGEFFIDRSPRRVPGRGDILLLDSAGCPLWHDLITREGHQPGVDPLGKPTLDGIPAETYTVENDYIFVMGDNQPASRDSRSWGFLPVKSVIGRALIVYWSLSDDGSIRWDRVGTFAD